MLNHLEILRITRENTLAQLNTLSIEQVNKIPEGFNNNIIWNAAHMVVTQQLLMYGLSGLELDVPNDWVSSYRKGTAPGKVVSEDDFLLIKAKMLDTVDKAIEDVKAKNFLNFKAYKTSYGVELKSIEDAIVFNNVHEGMHFGNILSMRKLV